MLVMTALRFASLPSFAFPKPQGLHLYLSPPLPFPSLYNQEFFVQHRPDCLSQSRMFTHPSSKDPTASWPLLGRVVQAIWCIKQIGRLQQR